MAEVRHAGAAADPHPDLTGGAVLSGHASIQITLDTYSHVLPGLDAQAAETRLSATRETDLAICGFPATRLPALTAIEWFYSSRLRSR